MAASRPPPAASASALTFSLYTTQESVPLSRSLLCTAPGAMSVQCSRPAPESHSGLSPVCALARTASSGASPALILAARLAR
jgi:hypothetical protein